MVPRIGRTHGASKGAVGYHMTCPIHLTLYRGGKAPVPVSQDDFEDWDEAATAIEDLVSRTSGAPESASREDQKLQLLAFAPHRLHTPHRLLKNVEEVTLLVIDVDQCSTEYMVAALEALNIDALMYTSPSDYPEGAEDNRRVRVVAPIDRPISVAECKQTRLAFAESLGLEPGCGVAGAPEASRIFFAGRLHDTPGREFWRFYEQ